MSIPIKKQLPMIIEDSPEPLDQAVLGEFRATLWAIETEVERHCYRYARDRIGQWMFVDCGRVDDVAEPTAGNLSAAYVRELLEAFKGITGRTTVSGQDIYRKVGALSDAINFLAEREEEREAERMKRKEWVAEVRVVVSDHWRPVDEMKPDAVDACHIRIARKRSPYLDPKIEYRIRNVLIPEIIEV